MQPAPVATRSARLALATSAIFAAFALTRAHNAAAFDSYGGHAIHDDLTKAASTDPAVAMDKRSQLLLMTAVRTVDWDETSVRLDLTLAPNAAYASAHHFDRGVVEAAPVPPFPASDAAFRAGAAYVQSRLAAAIAALTAVAPNPTAARTAAGEGLHALQDYFSHSNFTTLAAADQATVLAAMYNANIANAVLVPLPAALWQTGYEPFPTALWGDPGTPKGDLRPHKAHCKDNPTYNAVATARPGGVGTPTNHELAYAAAETASIDFLTRLQNGVALAQWTPFATALVTDIDPNNAKYQWVAEQVYEDGGFAVSSHGTTVVFAPGPLSEPLRAGVLAPPMNAYWDWVQAETDAGERMLVVREIRPLGEVFPAPATVDVTFDAAEVALLDADTLAVFTSDPAGSGWIPVPGGTVVYDAPNDEYNAHFLAPRGGVYAIGGVMVPADACNGFRRIIGEGVITFDTTGATTDGPDEPAGCSAFGYSHVESDIWFAYVPTCSGTATLALCGSTYDTKLAVYNSELCPPASALIACNDDSCGLQSQVQVPVTATYPVLVRIGGYLGDQGPGTLTITCTSAPGACCLPGGCVQTSAAACDAQGGVYVADGVSCSAGCIRRGDLNCDATIDFFDIDPFLLALFNPAGYHAAFPNCDISSADVNGSGSVDFFDIDPFLNCLFSTCP